MAEKEQQSPIPLAPAAHYGHPRSDAEAAGRGGATKRNKRTKCLLKVILFVLFQTGIVLLFTFTVMKIRTPKFRVLSATLDMNSDVAAPANGTLSVTMSAELGVKNSNFGRFKFDGTPVYFYHNGAQVAMAAAAKGRANWRSTKRLKVVVDVNVGNSAQLDRDMTLGVVSLSSRAELRGNVRLARLFKKRRSAYMNCTMQIVIGIQKLRNIVCH